MSYYNLRTLGISGSGIANSLFSSTGSSSSQFDYLANRALSNGIDNFTKKDYPGAVREFKRSIALSPGSAYADKAYEYMASAYINQNNTADAIKIYKQMIGRDPSNDSTHLSLGNIYFRAGKYKEAEAEYSMAVRVNPSSASNRYALGQTYNVTERYREAEKQFRLVTQITPADPVAYDALGQALRSQQKYAEAEMQFKKSVALDKKYADGYLGLGYTYADMKLPDKAQAQLDKLLALDKGRAAYLKDYIAKAADPEISMVFSTGGLPLSAGKGTSVSTIDDALLEPDASKTFTVTFMFSKEMDPSSVQNPNNWLISRATGSLPGGRYNMGLPLPSTEVLPPSKPVSVKYNESARMAELSVTLTQNSRANGTIDLSHLVFKFIGKDASGNSMDPSADEYSSVSKIV